jgi:HK97 family phage portal protein
LPDRYSDGWQANTCLDDARGPGPVEGWAALRRGVEIVVGQLGSTPLLTFNGDKEAPNSTAARCLRQTEPAHLETSLFDMVLSGNGWLRIVKDASGKPHHLECVQALFMSAAIENGLPVYRCQGQVINPDDYIHLQCRNAFSPYVGDGLVDSYSTSIGALLATVSIYRQLQSNGSHAEVFLTTDLVLQKDQVTQLRTAYDAQASNLGSAGGVVILSAGLKPMTVRALPSALDADIIKSLEFSVAEAARMTGVPLSMLGVKDSTAYNSAIEAHRSFHRVTMRPLFNRVEQELSRKLGATIRFDVGELVLGYGVERAEVLSKLLMAGVLTMNEARHSLAYSPLPGGDVQGLPANQIPLPVWLNGPSAKPSAPEAKP